MADIIQGFGPQNAQLKFIDQGDGTHALFVATTGGGGGGGAGADRELVVTTYRANANGTGYSVGDILTLAQVIDVTAAPTHVSSIWRNQTTGANISAPTASHLEMAGVPGLTDAQLRATAVAVSAASLPLPTGAATAANQGTLIGHVDGIETLLTTIDGRVDGLEGATGATTATAAAADGTGDYSIIAGIKRALLNWASLLGRVPAALVGGRFSVASSVPHMSTGVIMSAQTAATGTNWTAFASQACVALDIVNNTGTTIEYRRGAAGTAMQIPAGAARMVIGITNANQIDIRRTDTSNTQVTAQAEAFQH